MLSLCSLINTKKKKKIVSSTSNQIGSEQVMYQQNPLLFFLFLLLRTGRYLYKKIHLLLFLFSLQPTNWSLTLSHHFSVCVYWLCFLQHFLPFLFFIPFISNLPLSSHSRSVLVCWIREEVMLKNLSVPVAFSFDISHLFWQVPFLFQSSRPHIGKYLTSCAFWLVNLSPFTHYVIHSFLLVTVFDLLFSSLEITSGFMFFLDNTFIFLFIFNSFWFFKVLHFYMISLLFLYKNGHFLKVIII